MSVLQTPGERPVRVAISEGRQDRFDACPIGDAAGGDRLAVAEAHLAAPESGIDRPDKGADFDANFADLGFPQGDGFAMFMACWM